MNVLVDFRKAFDLIDHNILVRKLSDYYDIPNHIYLCLTATLLLTGDPGTPRGPEEKHLHCICKLTPENC